MLRTLMERVEEKEKETDRQGGSCDSSFAPYHLGKKNGSLRNSSPEDTSVPHMSESTSSAMTNTLSPPKVKATWGFMFGKNIPTEEDRTEVLKPTYSGYLPCHYFDYIGGTSTGG